MPAGCAAVDQSEQRQPAAGSAGSFACSSGPGESTSLWKAPGRVQSAVLAEFWLETGVVADIRPKTHLRVWARHACHTVLPSMRCRLQHACLNNACPTRLVTS
jgi:hypothetical protein